MDGERRRFSESATGLANVSFILYCFSFTHFENLISVLFLNGKESEKLEEDYRKGKILSGEVKKMLADKIVEFTKEFQQKLKKISLKDVEKCVLKNEN